MLRTILENQRVILEALRDGTDTGWITSEIDKRIEATSEELSKLHQPTVINLSHKSFEIRNMAKTMKATEFDEWFNGICDNL